MSGIDGGRIGAWGALPPPAGEAYGRARAASPHYPRRAPIQDSRNAQNPVLRPVNTGSEPASRHANTGFLAQVIAQEKLVLGARPEPISPKLPNEAYRRVQGDAGVPPGQVTGVDLTV